MEDALVWKVTETGTVAGQLCVFLPAHLAYALGEPATAICSKRWIIDLEKRDVLLEEWTGGASVCVCFLLNTEKPRVEGSLAMKCISVS